jgi:hypothetical protein
MDTEALAGRLEAFVGASLLDFAKVCAGYVRLRQLRAKARQLFGAFPAPCSLDLTERTACHAEDDYLHYVFEPFPLYFTVSSYPPRPSLLGLSGVLSLFSSRSSAAAQQQQQQQQRRLSRSAGAPDDSFQSYDASPAHGQTDAAAAPQTAAQYIVPRVRELLIDLACDFAAAAPPNLLPSDAASAERTLAALYLLTVEVSLEAVYQRKGGLFRRLMDSPPSRPISSSHPPPLRTGESMDTLPPLPSASGRNTAAGGGSSLNPGRHAQQLASHYPANQRRVSSPTLYPEGYRGASGASHPAAGTFSGFPSAAFGADFEDYVDVESSSMPSHRPYSMPSRMIPPPMSPLSPMPPDNVADPLGARAMLDRVWPRRESLSAASGSAEGALPPIPPQFSGAMVNPQPSPPVVATRRLSQTSLARPGSPASGIFSSGGYNTGTAGGAPASPAVANFPSQYSQGSYAFGSYTNGNTSGASAAGTMSGMPSGAYAASPNAFIQPPPCPAHLKPHADDLYGKTLTSVILARGIISEISGAFATSSISRRNDVAAAFDLKSGLLWRSWAWSVGRWCLPLARVAIIFMVLYPRFFGKKAVKW